MKLISLSLLLMLYGCDCSIYGSSAKNNKANINTNTDEEQDEINEYIKKINDLIKKSNSSDISEEAYILKHEYLQSQKSQDETLWNNLLEKAEPNILNNTELAYNLRYEVSKEYLLSDEQNKNILQKYKIRIFGEQPAIIASGLFLDGDKINIDNIKKLYDKGLLSAVLNDAGDIFKKNLNENNNELLKLISSEWVGASALNTKEKLYLFYNIKALPVNESNIANVWASSDVVTKENMLFLCVADDNMLLKAAETIKTSEDYKTAMGMFSFFYEDQEKTNFLKFYNLLVKNFIDNYQTYTKEQQEDIIKSLYDDNKLDKLISIYEENNPFMEALNRNNIELIKSIFDYKTLKDFVTNNHDYVLEQINKSGFSDQDKKTLKDIIDNIK